MPYFVGEAIRLANWTGPQASPTGGYLNQSNVLYDPTTPSLSYRLPGSNTITTQSGGALVKDAVGLYHFIVTPLLDGIIVYAFKSNDGAYAVSTVEIQPAPV